MPNRKQNRLTEFDYGQEGAYFVTLCTQNRARLFQMELPVGNGLCAVPEGADDRNGTTRRSCPTEGNAIIHKWVRETERKFPNIAIDKYVIILLPHQGKSAFKLCLAVFNGNKLYLRTR